MTSTTFAPSQSLKPKNLDQVSNKEDKKPVTEEVGDVADQPPQLPLDLIEKLKDAVPPAPPVEAEKQRSISEPKSSTDEHEKSVFQSEDFKHRNSQYQDKYGTSDTFSKPSPLLAPQELQQPEIVNKMDANSLVNKFVPKPTAKPKRGSEDRPFHLALWESELLYGVLGLLIGLVAFGGVVSIAALALGLVAGFVSYVLDVILTTRSLKSRGMFKTADYQPAEVSEELANPKPKKSLHLSLDDSPKPNQEEEKEVQQVYSPASANSSYTSSLKPLIRSLPVSPTPTIVDDSSDASEADDENESVTKNKSYLRNQELQDRLVDDLEDVPLTPVMKP